MATSKKVKTLRGPKFVAVAFATVLVLSACHFGSSKSPSGQVVAVVGGREITQRELQTEMGTSVASAPAARMAQQQAALQRIIQRVILANAAKDQGLDKDPSFSLLSQRANETLLGQLLENKVATSVPSPSSEEVEQFIQTNPDMFAQRELFDVDQIQAFRPADPKIIAQMEPLKTLDEIANFLTQNHIPFQRGTNVLDAAGLEPKLLKAIEALPASEVFIMSSANEISINKIRDTRISPFLGEPATQYARNSLKAQHAREAVVKQVNGILAKASSSVQINKAFEPPKPAPQKPQSH